MGISSIICKAYNVSQLTTEHENLVLQTFNTSNKHKILNWKTYNEIKNLPGVILSSNLDNTIDDFKIELSVQYAFYNEVLDVKNRSLIGYTQNQVQSTSFILYESKTITEPFCHTITDIVDICNNKIKSIVSKNKYDKPIDTSIKLYGGGESAFEKTNTVTIPPSSDVYIPVVFSAGKIEYKNIPKPTKGNEKSQFFSNVKTAITGYQIEISQFAKQQLGIVKVSRGVRHNQLSKTFIFDADDGDVTMKMETQWDLRNTILNNYVNNNEQFFWESVADKINVKNLDTVANLVERVNKVLSNMQDKLQLIKNVTKCKFSYDETTHVVTYHQPNIHKCQLHISPRILHIFGIITDNEWITLPLVTSDHKPSIDKFLQTMWIYSSIIQPQIMGDTLVHLLCIIPVIPEKETSLVSMVFDAPIYCKLMQNHISTIDILITSSMGDIPVHFDDDEVIIGLTFW